jgi:hypothetical protein
MIGYRADGHVGGLLWPLSILKVSYKVHPFSLPVVYWCLTNLGTNIIYLFHVLFNGAYFMMLQLYFKAISTAAAVILSYFYYFQNSML